MPSGAQPNLLTNLVPIAVMIAVFYFIVWKPEQDKRKQHQEKLAGLKKNTQVVTAGGIHGTVVNVKDETVTLRVDDNVRIEIDKSAVSTIKEA